MSHLAEEHNIGTLPNGAIRFVPKQWQRVLVEPVLKD